MRQEDDLGKWLEKVVAGSPASVFTTDTDDTRAALEALLTAERDPTRVVTLSWQRVPALGNELGLLVSALGEAAQKLYPELYGIRHATETRWPEADLETAIHEIRLRVPEVLAAACRQILSACRKNQRPVVAKLSNTEQVRQLALAIEPKKLVVLIAVHDPEVHAASLRALAQGAEWLASNTRARVILILPRALHTAPELDHVTYHACQFVPFATPFHGPTTGLLIPTAAQPSAANAPIERGKPQPAQVAVSPVEGKPHPKSDAEKVLYDRICSDAYLSQYFSFNRRVPTQFDSTPRVDLLSAHHRLVIEIDGDDHRRLFTWTNDRKRDIELFLSGYHVMRFASSTLADNTDRVLNQIRKALELLDTQESDR